MTQAILEKRTYDDLPFSILCASLLAPGATVSAVNTVLCDPSSAGLTFGTPIINSAQVTFPDGTIAPANTVIQVKIGGGAIPIQTVSLICTIRAQYTDSNGYQQEATAQLNLTDQVVYS